ncbi:zinc metalloprotease [Clostridium hydrogenum]|uniref:hypothetical protein n=1 Tax=Clostridium hydrogenum TaxID=2855764 RepID=UPI001F35A701|nr:hypothetical protein [Clostridium hydrogenum]
MDDFKPIVVSDIKSYSLFKNKNNEDIYCIGSLKKDKYIQLKKSLVDSIMVAISYFNGENTIDDIHLKLITLNNLNVDTNKLYNILNNAGFIENSCNANLEKNEYEKYGINIATLKLDKSIYFFKLIAKYIKLFFIISIFVILTSINYFIPVFYKMMNLNLFKIVNSSIISLIICTVITTISVILHEISHATIATRFSLKPKSLKLTLYLYVNSMIYICIPGIYTLSRKKRVYLWLSGVYCNFVIFCISAILQNYTFGTIHNIFLVSCYSNLGLIVTNLVPFLPLDGYFILSTILKIPNLRKNSFKVLKNSSKRTTFKVVYLVYFLISILSIFYLIISQIISIYRSFILGFNINNNIIDGLKEIKMYIFIFFIICFSKIKTLKSKTIT